MFALISLKLLEAPGLLQCYQSTEGNYGTLIKHLFLNISLCCHFQLFMFGIGWEVSVNIAYQESPIIITVCDRLSPEPVPFTEEVNEMQVKAPGVSGNAFWWRVT